MNAFVTVFYDWSRAVARHFTWLAPLAVRVTVGIVFMGTGWTKLQNLPGITRNFAALGIPAPEILTPSSRASSSWAASCCWSGCSRALPRCR